MMRSLSIALVLATASLAGAQPAKPSPTADAIKKAEQHFDKAEEFRKFGNFDDAVREYLAGYELTGAAEFLFNIGQAYREKGDKRMAVAYYKKYLAADPTGEGSLFAKSHLEILEKEIREEEEAIAARKRMDAEAEAKRKADAEAARKAAELTAQREADTKVSESDSKRRKTTAKWLRYGGIGTAGAGLIAAGVGIYFGRKASSLSDDVSREAALAGTWTDELEEKVSDADSAQAKMFVLVGGAGVALIGGGVMYYLGVRMDRPVERRIAITPIRGGAGVVLGGRF